jgi:sulfur-carrier protein
MIVQVRYFAAAKSAAGRDTESVELPAGASVNALATLLAERHGSAFTQVVKRCSYLVNEVAVRDHTRAIPENAMVDVLPPFAGG